MASTKRRRHRRTRRRARVARLTVKKYQCFYCVGKDGKTEAHWMLITSRGDVIFKNHPGVSPAALAAHAALQQAPTGCFYVALRLLYGERDIRQLVGNGYTHWIYASDAKMLSRSGRNLFASLDRLRSTRFNTREELERCKMRPISQSLEYRCNLLCARRIYRIHNLVRLIQTRWAAVCSSEQNVAEAEGAPAVEIRNFNLKTMLGMYGGFGELYENHTFFWDY